MKNYLAPNDFVDSDHAEVIRYAQIHSDSAASPTENAISLYYAIRDDFRYNPWRVGRSPEDYRASTVLTRPREEGGHCIDKANLLAACSRVIGIPSRLHFANVRNHIGTEDIEKILGTSLLVFHGYAELYLEEKWVAATPAFNKELCEHLKVKPLEFDGKEDSVFQEFAPNGQKFMEYVHDYGHFESLPFELMMSEWKKHYPKFASTEDWPGILET